MKKSLIVCCMLLCFLLFSACNRNNTPEPNPPAACQEHTWGNWKTVTPATCTESGSQERTCTACGKNQTIPKTVMHNYENDACTACGRSRYTAGLSYQLNEDETGYVLIGVGTATDDEIGIPPLPRG